MLAVCMLVGMVVRAKADSCVFRELCPISVLVVGESLSVLLLSCRMLIVVMMCKWSDDSAC